MSMDALLQGDLAIAKSPSRPTAPMILIGSRNSPFVRKVRVVLAEKGIDCEIKALDIVSDESAVYAYNPLGKIPCLIAENLGSADPLYDSSVIVEFLDLVSPNPPMYPTAPMDRIRVRRIEALADGMLDAGILARAELVDRGEGMRDRRWIDRQMKKIQCALSGLSDALSDRRYFNGESLSIADYTAGVALAWLDFRFPDLGWQTRYGNLARLLVELSARPSFEVSKL